MAVLETSLAPAVISVCVEDTDEALVVRCRNGDVAAFELLFHRHHDRVFRVAVRILHDRETALDTVQETFIRAHGSLAGYTGQGSFGSWLTRITANLAVDGLRRRRRRDRHETPWEPDDLDAVTTCRGARPDETAETAGLRGALETALARLSPMQRIVLVMKEIEGLSCEEIATALRCSVGTVMSRLHYARRKMQRRLDRLHIAP